MSGRKKKAALLFSLFFSCLCATGISALWLHSYQQTSFTAISTFCEILVEENPEMEGQIFSALKEYQVLAEQEVNGNRFLAQYGYSVDGFCKSVPCYISVLPAFLFFGLLCVFFILTGRTDRQNRKRIAELTEYLEQVNTGAGGTIIQTQEDDFSRLQDEMYKTVTALYQTRETAVAAKKRFADNLANIAHQLKTPVTAASLSLQLMKKTSPNDDVRQIEKQLERLNRLEEALLTLSQMDAGTLPFHNAKVDIYTALTLAAENLNDLLEKENISIEIPDNGCMEFSGDLEWTMEALINLMKNCMEHSKPGGIVHCAYAENPLYVEIRIWDDGAGFDPEDIPHLFERFYRGRRCVGNGIGIGLALARSVFELQNGTINARNLQGGGACFEIRVYSH